MKTKHSILGIIALIIFVAIMVISAVSDLKFIGENTPDSNDLIQPDLTSTGPSKSETEWEYSFPGDSEFSKNKFYSIGWLEEGILLVRSDLVKSDYGYRGAKIGHALNFAKAITEIKRSYTITARIPIKLQRKCPSSKS